ncbi:TraR/DksA family transcriptional regulator [Nigerium massiliense]|uniref:TraR/DksA family transcriptional regulator n=1 Tax=Nigerium massiliense TaxID=1522317 RepID=UPI00058DB3F8|nr:TraR/DksA C4-type zinc finger protein [Nigerium massiliense]
MSEYGPDQAAADLADKEAELRRKLARLTAPVEEGSTIGFGKRIGDGTTQAIQQMEDAGSAQIVAGTLDEVLRAQERLAAGTWGTCEVCGEPIDPGRLEVRPWSARCVEHADVVL